MFERYTEKARRVIFFSRYEASESGAQAIEAEHILLGLLREAKSIFQKLFPDPAASMAALRKEIESRINSDNKLPASVDLPLSQSAKQVLRCAAEESDRLGHRHIGTEHLLLGLIREGRSLASQILADRGVTAEKIIETISETGVPPFAVDVKPLPTTSEATTKQLIKQLQALLRILAERRIITHEESAAEFGGLPFTGFYALLDSLVSKGVITEDEKRDIINSGQ